MVLDDDIDFGSDKNSSGQTSVKVRLHEIAVSGQRINNVYL